jgi:hypothetical protein
MEDIPRKGGKVANFPFLEEFFPEEQGVYTLIIFVA